MMVMGASLSKDARVSSPHTVGNEQHTTYAADLLSGFLSPGQDVSDFVRSLVRRDARARLDDPANATRNGADGSGGGGGDTDLGAYQPTGDTHPAPLTPVHELSPSQVRAMQKKLSTGLVPDYAQSMVQFGR